MTIRNSNESPNSKSEWTAMMKTPRPQNKRGKTVTLNQKRTMKKYLNSREIALMLGLSVNSIPALLRGSRNGLNDFPLPEQINRKHFWLKRDVEKFILRRLESGKPLRWRSTKQASSTAPQDAPPIPQRKPRLGKHKPATLMVLAQFGMPIPE
jgi:predicted DNA-binding transcriptional regulator AlpA